jgi:hypothetical protein
MNQAALFTEPLEGGNEMSTDQTPNDRDEIIAAFRAMGMREGYHFNIPFGGTVPFGGPARFDGRVLVAGLEVVDGRQVVVLELDGCRMEMTKYAAVNLRFALGQIVDDADGLVEDCDA